MYCARRQIQETLSHKRSEQPEMSSHRTQSWDRVARLPRLMYNQGLWSLYGLIQLPVASVAGQLIEVKHEISSVSLQPAQVAGTKPAVLAVIVQCHQGDLRSDRFSSHYSTIRICLDSQPRKNTYYSLEISTRRLGSCDFWPSPVDRQAMFKLRQFKHGVRLSHRIWEGQS